MTTDRNSTIMLTNRVRILTAEEVRLLNDYVRYDVEADAYNEAYETFTPRKGVTEGVAETAARERLVDDEIGSKIDELAKKRDAALEALKETGLEVEAKERLRLAKNSDAYKNRRKEVYEDSRAKLTRFVAEERKNLSTIVAATDSYPASGSDAREGDMLRRNAPETVKNLWVESWQETGKANAYEAEAKKWDQSNPELAAKLREKAKQYAKKAEILMDEVDDLLENYSDKEQDAIERDARNLVTREHGSASAIMSKAESAAASEVLAETKEFENSRGSVRSRAGGGNGHRRPEDRRNDDGTRRDGDRGGADGRCRPRKPCSSAGLEKVNLPTFAALPVAEAAEALLAELTAPAVRQLVDQLSQNIHTRG